MGLHTSIKVKCTFLILFFAQINCSFAQDYERIEKLVGLFIKQTKAPGLSVAISKEGKMFAYTNRNEVNPKEKPPLVAFKMVK